MPVVRLTVKDEWAEAAEEMDMTLVEYTRRMIHAGRRQFGYDQSDVTSEVQHTLKIDDKESNTNVVKEFVARILSS